MNQHDSADEHNPFQTPSKVEVPRAGRVRQVRPVAICLIIHGVLIAIVGSGLTFAAVFLASSGAEFFSDDAGLSAMQGPMIWGYGIIGSGVLLLGLVSIYAGIRNWSFRDRTLGIIALSTGVITAMGVWCAPTAIGLAIWGLIVFLDPSVKRAFELAREGTKPKDLLAMVRDEGT